MTGNPDPAMFAGDEFLDSPIAFDNVRPSIRLLLLLRCGRRRWLAACCCERRRWLTGLPCRLQGTVISLVHTEYPGNRFNDTGPGAPHCTGPAYPTCWTVTIGLAISDDWGATWRHARPPPHHLVAAVPYGYNQSQPAYGWGDPSNIVKHPEEPFYYAAIWNRNQVGLQAPGICMMRTADLTDPAAWRAWDGKGYTVRFASPYTMPAGEAAEHICTVTNLPAGDTKSGCAPAGLVWSAYLKTFVVTLGCGSKFQVAFSDDLITWSTPQDLDVHQDMPTNVTKMIR